MGDEQQMKMGDPIISMTVAILLAFFGFVATVSGIILHLNVRGVVLGMKTEVAKLETKLEVARANADKGDAEIKLGLEQLKTRMAERDNERYREFVSEMQGRYASKDASDQKHAENSRRLDEISGWQTSFREEFSDFRRHIDERFSLFEERLPA